MPTPDKRKRTTREEAPEEEEEAPSSSPASPAPRRGGLRERTPSGNRGTPQTEAFPPASKRQRTAHLESEEPSSSSLSSPTLRTRTRSTTTTPTASPAKNTRQSSRGAKKATADEEGGSEKEMASPRKTRSAPTVAIGNEQEGGTSSPITRVLRSRSQSPAVSPVKTPLTPRRATSASTSTTPIAYKHPITPKKLNLLNDDSSSGSSVNLISSPRKSRSEVEILESISMESIDSENESPDTPGSRRSKRLSRVIEEQNRQKSLEEQERLKQSEIRKERQMIAEAKRKLVEEEKLKKQKIIEERRERHMECRVHDTLCHITSDGKLTEEQTETLEILRTSWKLVNFVHFTRRFRGVLGVTKTTIEEFEKEMMKKKSPLLINTFIQILNYSASRQNQATLLNWEDKLRAMVQRKSESSVNFPSDVEFFELPLQDIIVIIYELADYTVTSENFIISATIEEVDKYRIFEYGEDDDGIVYWYFGDARLYAEYGDKWSTVCITSGEWKEMLERMEASTSRTEKLLKDNILELAPRMISRIEQREKELLRAIHFESLPRRESSRISNKKKEMEQIEQEMEEKLLMEQIERLKREQEKKEKEEAELRKKQELERQQREEEEAKQKELAQCDEKFKADMLEYRTDRLQRDFNYQWKQYKQQIEEYEENEKQILQETDIAVREIRLRNRNKPQPPVIAKFETPRIPKHVKFLQQTWWHKKEELGYNVSLTHNVEIAPSLIPMNLLVKAACVDILEELREDRKAKAFLYPVEVEKLGLYDYYLIVKKPMDLYTCYYKLMTDKYTKLSQFKSDVLLIFSNCYAYNLPESEVVNNAKHLERRFKELFKTAPFFELIEDDKLEEIVNSAQAEASPLKKLKVKLRNDLASDSSENVSMNDVSMSSPASTDNFSSKFQPYFPPIGSDDTSNLQPYFTGAENISLPQPYQVGKEENVAPLNQASHIIDDIMQNVPSSSVAPTSREVPSHPVEVKMIPLPLVPEEVASSSSSSLPIVAATPMLVDVPPVTTSIPVSSHPVEEVKTTPLSLSIPPVEAPTSSSSSLPLPIVAATPMLVGVPPVTSSIPTDNLPSFASTPYLQKIKEYQPAILLVPEENKAHQFTAFPVPQQEVKEYHQSAPFPIPMPFPVLQGAPILQAVQEHEPATQRMENENNNNNNTEASNANHNEIANEAADSKNNEVNKEPNLSNFNNSVNNDNSNSNEIHSISNDNRLDNSDNSINPARQL